MPVFTPFSKCPRRDDLARDLHLSAPEGTMKQTLLALALAVLTHPAFALTRPPRKLSGLAYAPTSADYVKTNRVVSGKLDDAFVNRFLVAEAQRKVEAAYPGSRVALSGTSKRQDPGLTRGLNLRFRVSRMLAHAHNVIVTVASDGKSLTGDMSR